MAKWTRDSDGSLVLDTDDLQLSKSMRLMDTDLGQQLLEQPHGEPQLPPCPICGGEQAVPDLLKMCSDLLDACDNQMFNGGVTNEVLTAMEQARVIIVGLSTIREEV